MAESQSLPILAQRPRRACPALRDWCPQPLKTRWGILTPGVRILHTGPPAGGMSTSKSPGADLARKDTCRQSRRPPEIPRFTGQALVSGKKNASQLLKRPSGLLPSPAKARQMLLERAGPARVTRPPSYVCFSVSADTGHRAEKTIHFGPRQRASGRPGLGSLARLFIYSLSLARQLCKEVLEPACSYPLSPGSRWLAVLLSGGVPNGWLGPQLRPWVGA